MERLEVQLATLTALLANIYRKSGSSPARPIDFMVGMDEARSGSLTTPEEQQTYFRFMTAAMGGTINEAPSSGDTSKS